jgi:signal transduction histidine kinase
VEAAAYFIVSESLTNAAKHARAAAATVRIARANATAVVEVSDDGIGGADATRGSGLRGLADRLAALDGTLEVESPASGGTRVQARIPCA